MSAAPRFRLVLLIENREITLFGLQGKSWSAWDKTLSTSDPVPAEILEEFAGEPALILVSDSHNGHLQITVPNKKKNLETAALTQLLEEEYDIDTSAYLLGWNNYPLSRDQVQISVSGVEREVVEAATEWITPLQPKKLWAMPFAWFASVLKSVDPAFIAVESQDALLVSHHYLGVDDARSLKLGEVEKYIAARQKERKETHLLYLQASEKTASSLQKKLEKSDVTIQTLLPDAKKSSLEAVVDAVIERGSSALGELLFFELDVPEMDPTTVPDSAVVAPVDEADAAEEAITDVEEIEASPAEETPEDVLEAETADLEEAPAGLLPPVPPPLAPPVPPAATAAMASRGGASVEVVEDEADLEETEETTSLEPEVEAAAEEESASPVQEETNIRPVEEVPAEVAVGAATILAKEEKRDRTELQDQEVAAAPVEPQEDVFSKLKGSGVHSSNVERYAPVEAKRSWKGPILVFFVVVVVTALIGGGIFWSQQGRELLGALPETVATPSPVASPTVSPSPIVEASPSPSPAPAVDKSELTVLVVNATGVNGLAGRVSEQLGTSGWDNVQAGNAGGTYPAGATYVNQGLDPAVIAALEEDLDREITPRAVTESRASQFDIVIVLAQQ